MGVPKFAMTYNFHLCTVNKVDASIEGRSETYEHFEDLLKDYRRLKDALFMEYFNYCTDFKVFKLEAKEMPLTTLDDLL